MKVTRDVILDLWPVYEAGEASEDTRALVESFLEQDPEFARLIREKGQVMTASAASIALPPDKEQEALLTTIRLLRQRTQLLVVGLICPLFAAMYRFPGWQRLGGVSVGRVIFLAIGAAAWVGFWRVHRRLRVKGL